MPRASLSQYIFSRGVIVFRAFALYILDYDLKLSIYSLAVVIRFLESDACCVRRSLQVLT
jgi:hypothetical protein